MSQAAIGARAGTRLDVGADASRLALLAALSAASGAGLDLLRPAVCQIGNEGRSQILPKAAILSDILY
jgi:hypothetical protein